jgi:hypothetical protein
VRGHGRGAALVEDARHARVIEDLGEAGGLARRVVDGDDHGPLLAALLSQALPLADDLGSDLPVLPLQPLARHRVHRGLRGDDVGHQSVRRHGVEPLEVIPLRVDRRPLPHLRAVDRGEVELARASAEAGGRPDGAREPRRGLDAVRGPRLEQQRLVGPRLAFVLDALEAPREKAAGDPPAAVLGKDAKVDAADVEVVRVGTVDHDLAGELALGRPRRPPPPVEHGRVHPEALRDRREGPLRILWDGLVVEHPGELDERADGLVGGARQVDGLDRVARRNGDGHGRPRLAAQAPEERQLRNVPR